MRIDHNFLHPDLLEIELERLRTFVPAESTSYQILMHAVRYVFTLLF